MSQSTGCFKTFTRVIAAFLALFVVISLPITLLVYDFSRVLFSPEVISEVLTTRLIDSGLVQNIVSDVLLSPEWLGDLGPRELDLGRIFEDLTPAERETMFGIILPPGWIQEQISTLVMELNIWIDNDQPLPRMLFNMRPIKQSLARGGAEEIVDMIVDSWSSCTPEQLRRISETGIGGETPLPLCEPPEPFRSELIDFANTQIAQSLRQIPAEFPLVGDEFDERGFADIAELKGNIRLVRALTTSGWLLPIALLFLIMALAVRSARDLSRWWGIPLMLSGAIIFGMVVLGSLVGENLLNGLFAGIRSEMEIIYTLLMNVTKGFLESILGFLLFHALLVGGIGFVLLVVGWLIGRRSTAIPSGQPSRMPQIKDIGSTPGTPPTSSYVHPPPPVSPMPLDAPESENDSDQPSGIFG